MCLGRKIQNPKSKIQDPKSSDNSQQYWGDRGRLLVSGIYPLLVGDLAGEDAAKSGDMVDLVGCRDNDCG
jgi:hypothetical protein